MTSPDIFAVMNAFFALFSRYADVIVNLPYAREIVGAGNSEFIRIAAGAFTGSGSAWIIFLYFREQFHLLPLRFRRDHTIVCGLNYHSLLIVKDLVRKKQKPVVIEKDLHNISIESCRFMGVIVIIGEPTDSNLLLRAGARRARYILACNNSDETNAETVLQAMQVIPYKKRRVVTFVIQMSNPMLYMMIRKQTYTKDCAPDFRVGFFNRYAMGAKILIDQYPPLHMRENAFVPFPVIIFGAGMFGENIITKVARTWYEQKFPPESRPRIYLVDVKAEYVLENLNKRFEKLVEACNLVPVTLDVQSAAFQNGTFLEDPALREGFTAYICFDDDTLGLYTALTLHQNAQGKKIKNYCPD